MRRIPTASREYIEPFILEHIDPAALLRTDGSQVYTSLEGKGYRHDRIIVKDLVRGKVGELPVVNRVASLLHRWLLGTHHGAVQPPQLDYYLEEFVFRFNRHTFRSRGMLFYRLLSQACQAGPITYTDVVRRPLRAEIEV